MKYCEANPGDCPDEALFNRWYMVADDAVGFKALCPEHDEFASWWDRLSRASQPAAVSVDRRTGLIL